MGPSPTKHCRKTGALARALSRAKIFEWLVTAGYFPESYVLPPCFFVTRHPTVQKRYFDYKRKKYSPKITEYLRVQFPKTELTDRTFGVIDPEIHSDIARTLVRNWKTLTACLFHRNNKVSSYSFPLPLNGKKKGSLGTLRGGRMIYEFIEMENDLAAVAYRYKFLITTDVKNFYPSIYTHSIPWAIHGKARVRRKPNRYNYNLFGNRLDKLFQNANDGCTNGIPIGPVVSDLIAEVVLAAVDRMISTEIKSDVAIARFKDDYRILAKTEEDGKAAVKALQTALKEFSLELNDDKTEVHALPDGLFRTWASEYHSANPRPKAHYGFKRFKEVCLSVVRIDRNNPGSGVIDRFLADLVTRKQKLRLSLDSRRLPQVMSLLLLLASLRVKAFPKVLAIIELALKSSFGRGHAAQIADHLAEFLQQLSKREPENRYLIAWICYFLRANGFEGKLKGKCNFLDPIVRAIYTSRFVPFKKCRDFKLFQGVKTSAKRISMLKHLDVFSR
jgi:hypothetical protein